MRPKSVVVPDARDRGATLRVTRHPEQHKVVLSHWRGRVCVASTPIELAEVPMLIGVLVDALNEAASARPPSRMPELTGSADVVAALRRWLRPRLAQVRELRSQPGSPADEHAS